MSSLDQRDRRVHPAWGIVLLLGLCALMPPEVLGWTFFAAATGVALLAAVDVCHPGKHSGWLKAVTGSTVRIEFTSIVAMVWGVGTLVVIGLLLVGWHSTLF